MSTHALLLGLSLLTAQPQDAEEGLSDRLDALLEGALAHEDLRGIAVVIDLGGETLFEGARGRIHFGGNERADPEAPIPAACAMDLFGAVLALQLMDEGVLDPDAPLAGVLPGLAWEGHTVTLHHLLTHTSGIPALRDLDPEGTAIAAASGAEAGWTPLAGEPLEDVPGRCQTFRDTNTYLVGRAVERAAGKPLRELLAERVFDALELDSTGFVEGAGEELDEVRTRVECAGWLEEDPTGTLRFDAAELVTSARDLARLARGLAAREVVGGRGYARLAGVQRLDDGDLLRYAYGLSRAPLEDIAGLSFGGANGHERLHVACYPDLGLTVAMTADAADGVLPALERRLVREVFDLSSPEVEDRALPEGRREAYTGTYQLGCNRLLVVAEGERLSLEAADRPRFTLLYQGNHGFVAAEDHDVSVTFKVEGERALALNLIERGAFAQAVRVD